MNILIVTEVFYPEEFVINDFAQEMVRKGHCVRVMTRQPSYPAGHVFPGYDNKKLSSENWEGVEIYRFDIIEGYKVSKIRKIWNYHHFVRRGKEVIIQLLDGIDVILVHQTGPLSVAIPAIYAKERFKIPVVVWTFDIWPDHVYMYGFPHVFPISYVVNMIIKKVYGKADAVLISSQRFEESIHNYYPSISLTYAPSWVIPSDGSKSRLKFDASKHNFVFTGNISHAQNVENMIKGFAMAKIGDATLNIVGDGTTLEKNQRIADDLGCDHVFFHGRIPYSEIRDTLMMSDYLVLPMTSKAGIDKTEPYKLQSYLLSGKPIYGILNGAGRDVIEQNHLGVCSNPDNLEDIARGFRQMISLSFDEKEKIKESALNLMNTRYNRNKIINTIESVLKGVSDRHYEN